MSDIQTIFFKFCAPVILEHNGKHIQAQQSADTPGSALPLWRKYINCTALVWSNHYLQTIGTELNLRLVLYVSGVGLVGEVVTVSKALARNTLLPSGQAVYPSEYNLTKFKRKEVSIAQTPTRDWTILENDHLILGRGGVARDYSRSKQFWGVDCLYRNTLFFCRI